MRSPSHPYILLFASEAERMAREALTTEIETGGSLFGLWSQGDRPVIFIASPPGPSAIHEATHFAQNERYISAIAEMLHQTYGIQYLGDWHSHHKLGLREPSGGDKQRIQRVAMKNRFLRMAEIIVRHPDGSSRDEDLVFGAELNAFIYTDAARGRYQRCSTRVLRGASPVRAVLSRENSALLEGLRIDESANKKDEIPIELRDALDNLCSVVPGEVSVHEDGIGYIVKVAIRPNTILVIVLSQAERFQDMRVLSINVIDVKSGASFDIGEGFVLNKSAIGPRSLIEIYEAVEQKRPTTYGMG